MDSHFLQVSESHTVHYQIIGDDHDPPLILIHGGPGAGCTDNDLNFIRDIKIRTILLDQRGCGKSTPAGNVTENTTQLLIADIISLMDHLQISKAKILGGSWGSTLATLFALQYHERVESLILRGLFLGTQASRSVYEDPDTDAYRILNSQVPSSYEGTVWEYYYDQLLSNNTETQRNYARLFAEYNLHQITEGKVKQLDEGVDIDKVLATNRIRLHYSVNDFFIAENYIWDHIQLLADIPITIVHGEYDEVCAPVDVRRWAKLLPHTKVLWVKGGHSPKEKAIIQGVRKAILSHLNI